MVVLADHSDDCSRDHFLRIVMLLYVKLKEVNKKGDTEEELNTEMSPCRSLHSVSSFESITLWCGHFKKRDLYS